jgi:hypothetical protein
VTPALTSHRGFRTAVLDAVPPPGARRRKAPGSGARGLDGFNTVMDSPFWAELPAAERSAVDSPTGRITGSRQSPAYGRRSQPNPGQACTKRSIWWQSATGSWANGSSATRPRH